MNVKNFWNIFKQIFFYYNKIVDNTKIFKIVKTISFLGSHNNILALMVLPFAIRTASKKIKLKSKQITASKQEISKCFILHIEVKFVKIFFITFNQYWYCG